MFEFNIFAQDFLNISTVIPSTLALALLILLISIALGGVLAFIEQKRVFVLWKVSQLFRSFLRGTPLLVQLYLAFYCLPVVLQKAALLAYLPFNQNDFNPVYTVIVAYSVHFAVFQSEIIRGSFLSVGYGQIEAAQASGFSFFQTMRRIIIPQAIIEALPNFFNSYLSVIKSLSLAFLVGVVDILAKAKLESALNFRYLESYAAAATAYWLLCSIMTYILGIYEKLIRKRA
ncbi:ABC transporter permease subunit [Sporolactobacillus shoreicorticis]|uniref:Amino acid ABC transporter permease n=1 Tax=Sporolactobacillus shoreicorticis TaxID=1923877 RepID=A0ABW5S221_9BACL|nr:ABC transporter permease subunit [Sporolactobacillus shoreicorticis]MCO7126530.1 ABC transporter permease subunit [Sporolactobacillus shoreicorticis]